MRSATASEYASDGTKIGGRFGRALGAALLANYLVVVVAKIVAGKGPELLWMSHVGLLVAAVALLLGSRLLVGVALTGIFVIHGMWITDAISYALGRGFPFSMATYLAQGDALMWVGTAHHLYLMPLLLALVLRDGRYPILALPVTMGVFLALTILCRVALPASENVNCAYEIRSGPSHPLIAWLNGLPGPAYVAMLNVLAAPILFVPIALLLSAWALWRRGVAGLRR